MYRLPLETLTVVRQSNPLHFVQSELFLQYSQQPPTGPCVQSLESRPPPPPFPYSKIRFNIILSCMPSLDSALFASGLLHPSCVHVSLPCMQIVQTRMTFINLQFLGEFAELLKIYYWLGRVCLSV